MATEQVVLDDVLEKFPFKNREDQDEILAEYVEAKLKGNLSETAQQVEVSRPTVNKIQERFNDLSPKETAVLMTHLNGILQRKNIERQTVEA